MTEITSPATATPEVSGTRGLTAAQRRRVLAGSIGNLVEYVDWALFATFTPVFAPHFFPSDDPIAGVLATLVVFAVGFVMRPVGGAVLGVLADRVGRKRILTLTVLLMSGASFVIGLCPGYETIGVAAPIVLVVARLVQGFSAGGEAGSSMTFLVESAPTGRRAFIGSFQQVSTGAGLLVASLLGTVLTATFSAGALDSWGWRLAFVIGGVLGLVGIWLRNGVPETEHFTQAQETTGQKRAHPIVDLFRHHPKAALRAFGITIPATVVNYMWLTYMPVYAHTTQGIPLDQALLANSIALAVYCVTLPFVGRLSDRIGRKPFFLVFSVGFMVLPWPAFHFLSADFWVLLVIELIGVLLLACDSAIIAAAYSELFPVEVRTTGTALCFAAAVAAFGGTAPYIMTSLFAHGLSGFVWLYVAIAAAIGTVFFATLPETKDKELS
ncbi:MFS transporter [Streptomyces sp. NPDC004542]|uniref:MFS transporter n=1 Tax=Streptomyces sp. NPDC004542 TaxID=3154281 RepID=UPI0033B8E35F